MKGMRAPAIQSMCGGRLMDGMKSPQERHAMSSRWPPVGPRYGERTWISRQVGANRLAGHPGTNAVQVRVQVSSSASASR